MPAGLTFYKDLQRREEDQTSNPGEAKVIVYEDGGGNKYTLDASSVSGLSGVDDIKLSNLLKAEVKFKYHPSGGEEAETKGLGNIISTLFATKSASTANSKTILEEEVADKSVVKAIFSAKEQPTDTQSILATKVADKDVVKAIFNAKEQPADTQSILATKVADKDVVKAIFSAKEQPADTQSILATKVAEQAVVDVLVPALATVGTDDTKKVYTKKTVDDALKLKADASTLRDLVLEKGLSAQAVATQLLSTAKTKDDLGKAILGVTKEVDGTAKPALETDLAGNKILQDAVASNGTLKAALAKPEDIAKVKALQDAVATNTDLRTAVKGALASDTTFQGNVKITVNSNEPGFQGSVREVMSKPVFEIPADDNAPLSWDW